MFNFVLSLISYLIYGLIAVFLAFFSALFVSKHFRKVAFAKFYTNNAFQEWCKGQFGEHRPGWLKDFNNIKNTNGKLNVLEVGAAGGANFDHYPDNVRLTVIDFNENFKQEFTKNVGKHPEIEFVEYLTGSVEDMNQLKDNTFDVVLATHLFCSVPNPPKGIQEIRRVLKKGGKYFFVEHCAYHKVSPWTIVQYIFEPIWPILFCGCHQMRKTWLTIQNGGFKSVQLTHHYPESVMPFVRPQVYGYCIE